MNSYLLKRILLFFPSIAGVILITIYLGNIAGEVPAQFLDPEGRQFNSKSEEKFIKENFLREPLFYFSLGSEKLENFPLIIPKATFNGKKNRFHRYGTNILSGSLGFSESYKKPVIDVLIKPFFVTLSINLLSIIFSYSFGIFIAYYIVSLNNKWLDKASSFINSLFFSIPSFWLGILLIWLFANRQNLYIFPASGWYSMENFNLNNIIEWILHLILPVISLSLGALAYISLTFKKSLEKEIDKPYFITALSKGQSRNEAIRKHAIRNSLMPILAVSLNILPALISGSVIIESIFGIPGMGKLAFDSFLSRDLPIVYAITFLAASLTWVNWLLVDYLYSRLNPKLNF